jgi:hypothetical protein
MLMIGRNHILHCAVAGKRPARLPSMIRRALIDASGGGHGPDRCRLAGCRVKSKAHGFVPIGEAIDLDSGHPKNPIHSDFINL